MPTFGSADKLKDFATYKTTLKTAIGTVKPGGVKKFAYYKAVDFSSQEHPALLVDFDLNCTGALSKRKVPAPVVGLVSVTDDDKLKFVSNAGKVIGGAMQRALTAAGVTRQVFIPADEVDEATGSAPGGATDSAPSTDPTAQTVNRSRSTTPTAAPPPVQPVNRSRSTTPTSAPPAPTGAPPANPVGAPPTPTPQRVGRAALTTPTTAPVQPTQPATASTGKAQELTTRVNDLRGKVFPPDLAGMKDEVLKRLGDLATRGEQAAATYLDGLEAKIVPYDAFRDPAHRKSDCEKTGEEAIALQNLIQSKIGNDKKAQAKWQPIIAELGTMLMKPMSVHMEVAAVADDDPNRQKKIDDGYAKLQTLKNRKAELAGQIKELWIKDKKKQLIGELKSDKEATSLKMANCLGVEQFLEMAQMAEVMARKSTKGFNPFKPEKGKPGAPTEPMTLAEVAAIYGYSTQDFTTINGILRGSKTNPAEVPGATATMPSAKELLGGAAPSAPAKTQDYRPYIDACVKALAKLPPYPSNVVRADPALHASIMAQIISSGTRTEKAFMSTGLKQVPGFGSVITHISGVKTGKEITMFSLHDTEGEVLFPPGSVFKFVSFDPQDGTPVVTDHKLLANLTDSQKAKGEYRFTQVS